MSNVTYPNAIEETFVVLLYIHLALSFSRYIPALFRSSYSFYCSQHLFTFQPATTYDFSLYSSITMQLLPFLLLLPALAVADTQKPLMEKAAGWFGKAKSYIPSAVVPPSPIDAGVSKVAELVVENITSQNWKEKLLPVDGDPSNGPKQWMVMFSGNKSCYGRCEQADKAFNASHLKHIAHIPGLV